MSGPRTGEPVRVVLRMEIVSGREREFEELWLEIARTIGRSPANRGQVLARAGAVDGASVYYVYTDWTDEASFRAFETSRHHGDNRRRLGPLRAGGDMTVTAVVHTLEGPA
ncbi:antibiotic biosynthesis monooxygenase family protein [Streptomyces sp. NPDC008196]|uniref:antibiotic biosynthesis monooxygenase family protein n=1 Tax=unclassified Streptomyces TaxID=2593676 RepID=UPI001BAE8CF0|nr:antibiotic biosynthesis monooxygenase family protein [Streptomyces sp. A2-16]QUC57366.1 antibiotic biosynthesis monooxygenase [Streptomyces sp. A2-16]